MDGGSHVLAELPARRRRSRVGPSVSVLAVDPDLGQRLTAPRFAIASERCRAKLLRLSPGAVGGWPLRGEPEPGFHGFLVVRGLVTRRVTMGELHAAELFGPGDLVRPWELGDEGDLHQSARWRVHDQTDLAILGRSFARAAAAWPEIGWALRDRESARMHSLVTRLLIAQSPRISDRVHLLLWHLAARWGSVGPDGVSLPLLLSKTLVAELVCTTRESASRALTALTLKGSVAYTETGFLLCRQPSSGGDRWAEGRARNTVALTA